MSQMTLKAKKAAEYLREFIGIHQLYALGVGCLGEESAFFNEKLINLAKLINAMPKTFETDGQGDKAIARLHYFKGQCDWYITERDCEPQQYQAFGLTDLRQGSPELGYISISELIENSVELDLFWKPCAIGAIRAKVAA